MLKQALSDGLHRSLQVVVTIVHMAKLYSRAQ